MIVSEAGFGSFALMHQICKNCERQKILRFLKHHSVKCHESLTWSHNLQNSCWGHPSESLMKKYYEPKQELKEYFAGDKEGVYGRERNRQIDDFTTYKKWCESTEKSVEEEKFGNRSCIQIMLWMWRQYHRSLPSPLHCHIKMPGRNLLWQDKLFWFPFSLPLILSPSGRELVLHPTYWCSILHCQPSLLLSLFRTGHM